MRWLVLARSFVLAGLAFLASSAPIGATGQQCYGFRVTLAGVQHTGSDEDSACASFNHSQGADADAVHSTDTYSAQNITGSGADETWTCDDHNVTTVNGTAYPSDSTAGYGDRPPISCPAASCSTPSGNYDVQVTTGSPISKGTQVCGADSCNYTMGPTNSFRTWAGMAGGKPFVTQTASTDGTTCSASGSTPPPQIGSNIDASKAVTDCTTTGGAISCVTQDASTGKYCGTYNGDSVCVGDVPVGKCVAFASGGVACTVPTTGASSPPAPDSGTAGTPATPTASLSSDNGTTNTVTNYYNSAVVAKSTVPVSGSGIGATDPAATPPASSSSNSSSSTGGNSAPNGANGDCGASGVNCTSSGDATLPTLDTEPSIASTLQTYYTALANVPIVAAFTGISTAFSGEAQCQTFTFSMFNHSYVMDEQCTLLNNMASVIGAIMLAVYVLTGFRIVMSG